MRYLSALLVLFVVSAVDAADPVSDVKSAIESLNDAFAKQDATKVRSLMAPNHFAITPFAGMQRLDDQLRTLPDLKYDKYSPGPMSVTTVTETCVLLAYELNVQGTYRGKPLPSNSLVTALWVENEGKWQELQYQETAVNEDSATDAQLLNDLTILEKRSWEATTKGDKEYFKAILADKATCLLADGTVIDRKKMIENLDDLHLKTYTIGKASLLRVSEDTAVILYPASYEAERKGVRESYSAVNCSVLYVRRSGKWAKLLYQETANNPAASKR